MLLTIDIGNTNVTVGVWDGAAWRTHWRLRTVHDQTVDEYWVHLGTLLREAGVRDAINAVILTSVVPPLTRAFVGMCAHYLQLTPLRVDHTTDSGVAVVTDNPAEVGADRIVNAAAVSHLYGGPCIVIDMGTATTFDVVSADAELLGVVIAPGLRLSADALISRAAQLSEVAFEAPPTVLGRNTIHAVQSGLIYGYVSLVEGVIERLSAELDMQPTVIGTGGLISLIAEYTDCIHAVEPWLTLIGLRLIHERVNNQKTISST
ncbi:MAG: type III pantothenate kinase [Anaerolineae bacterium]|nr:type III pantothenate kinase [Anaerolineae bacterium]MCO5186635.1 type III pantothenate kinase [Anaerolineae bacterium]MCO5195766.1 type III pantothenate kinase [Anaerolineae bacterium]MCO5198028.1 type III pantothenate kinase [Anaerolineae bacterium]MCO5206108.1 type III pantothenate kinase [Anaerolineae bacterium]